MKKLFLFIAALMTATVMNLQATNVYFKTTAATAWWANDGAKIGALFKVGTDPIDEGAYAAFFTLVPGTTDTYVGTVPEPEEDPFVAVQFLRYNSAATNPEDMNYWNGTALMTWDGTNDLFTATGSGDTWDGTTGTWSKYAPALDPVKYLAPVYNTTGDPTSGILRWDTLSCTNYTVVADASSQVTWNAGWYVVTGNVTLSAGAVCNGAVHLILADGAMLTTTGSVVGVYNASAGIQVSGSDNSLTIYGQEGQTGILIATGGYYGGMGIGAAGIGGGAYSDEETDASGSNSTINGGVVTAMGAIADSMSGAGIGGGSTTGDGNTSGKNITINGGTVTATGGISGAGIGGGYNGEGSNITINGGTVTANGGSDATGIGSGASGDDAVNIFVNPSIILKAGSSPSSIEVIAPTRTATTDIAGDLADKQYTTVETPVDTVQIAVPTSAEYYTLTDGTMTQLAIESLPSYKAIYLCFKSGSMVGTFTSTDFDYEYTFMEDYQSNYTSLEKVNGTLAMYGDTIVFDFYMKDAEKNKWYHVFGTVPTHEPYDEKTLIWNSDFDNGKYNYDYLQDNLIYIEATQDSPSTRVVLEWKGNTLVPGVYNLDTIAGSFRKGYTDGYSLYGSYVYQPTPFHVWWLTQGTITVAENGDVTIDAMNTYDKTINCTIHLEAPVYGRKLSAKGNYGTICLRNAITATEGVEALYVPKYKDANFLYCEEVPVDSAKAGYAYIFQAQAAVDTVTFFQASGIPAVAAVEANYMLGWLGAATTIDNSFKSTYPGYALLMGNSVYAWEYCEAESQIMPNRAMINLANVTTEQQPAAPGRRMVAFGRNTATGLNQLTDSPVNRFTKMMINGQFVIIRDGRKFNAQGQEL